MSLACNRRLEQTWVANGNMTDKALQHKKTRRKELNRVRETSNTRTRAVTNSSCKKGRVTSDYRKPPRRDFQPFWW